MTGYFELATEYSWVPLGIVEGVVEKLNQNNVECSEEM